MSDRIAGKETRNLSAQYKTHILYLRSEAVNAINGVELQQLVLKIIARRSDVCSLVPYIDVCAMTSYRDISKTGNALLLLGI